MVKHNPVKQQQPRQQAHEWLGPEQGKVFDKTEVLLLGFGQYLRSSHYTPKHSLQVPWPNLKKAKQLRTQDRGKRISSKVDGILKEIEVKVA